MNENGVSEMKGRILKNHANVSRQGGFVGCPIQNERSDEAAKTIDERPAGKTTGRAPGSTVYGRRSRRNARRAASAGISILGFGGPRFAA